MISVIRVRAVERDSLADVEIRIGGRGQGLFPCNPLVAIQAVIRGNRNGGTGTARKSDNGWKGCVSSSSSLSVRLATGQVNLLNFIQTENAVATTVMDFSTGPKGIWNIIFFFSPAAPHVLHTESILLCTQHAIKCILIIKAKFILFLKWLFGNFKKWQWVMIITNGTLY